ncbi:hypothetical protein ACO0K9_26205 [Undibacterium sp. Ji50W]|uniref:hypothetical protein n=1 Tax=Undibacterium sp. Ji50W TaxID=3413041 RepID=UPI003BF26B89
MNENPSEGHRGHPIPQLRPQKLHHRTPLLPFPNYKNYTPALNVSVVCKSTPSKPWALPSLLDELASIAALATFDSNLDTPNLTCFFEAGHIRNLFVKVNKKHSFCLALLIYYYLTSTLTH